MLNQLVIVGRLISDPQINEINGKKESKITLAVQRSYKNENGEYDTDFIECILWEGIAEKTFEFCHKGDIIGVKGRVESIKMASGYFIQIIAEKLTFLNSKN